MDHEQGEQDDSDDSSDPLSVINALQAIADGSAELGDVLCAISGIENPPEQLTKAVGALFEIEGDLANGGADQVVWNRGHEVGHAIAQAWDEVGAIENAELFARLASELAAYDQEPKDPAIADDAVKRFLGYRRRVSGPFFAVPDPHEELAEAVVEWAVAHAHEFPTPDAYMATLDSIETDNSDGGD